MSEKKGFFARLRQGMSKSREQIAAVTEDALQADAPIDEDLYDALLDAMILSDMGAACAEEALEKLKQSTRRYAKRQLTWFGTDQRMRWIEPDTLAAGETPLDKAMEILEKEGMA